MEEIREIKSMTVLSQILSIVFFPGFIPVYGLLILFYSPTVFAYELDVRYGDLKRIIFLLAFINMTVVPLAAMPLLKFRNIISSYSMNVRGERLIPLGIGCIMYVITSVIFYSFHVPELIKTFVLAATIASLLILLITTKFKISLHAAGMGSILATVMVLSLRMYVNLIYLWLPLILLAGMVMAARLYLKSHRPIQIYSGFLLGFITFWFVMMM